MCKCRCVSVGKVLEAVYGDMATTLSLRHDLSEKITKYAKLYIIYRRAAAFLADRSALEILMTREEGDKPESRVMQRRVVVVIADLDVGVCLE